MHITELPSKSILICITPAMWPEMAMPKPSHLSAQFNTSRQNVTEYNRRQNTSCLLPYHSNLDHLYTVHYYQAEDGQF